MKDLMFISLLIDLGETSGEGRNGLVKWIGDECCKNKNTILTVINIVHVTIIIVTSQLEQKT